ncbi:MAG: SpoIVB peptidase [Clostridia bacterium]|nr:SpoIVB peptidase [Clostridia bacterium]
MQNKKIFYLLGIILFFILLYFVIEYIFIPKNIYMTTGESYVVNISAPFNGEIESDEVLNINNEKVSDNIEVSLKDKNVISSDTATVADMNVKLLGLPIKKVELCFMPEKKVEVIGRTVGICVDTKGVLVLGVGSVKGYDNKDYMPCKNLLKSGDIILSVNGNNVGSKEDLMNLINNGNTVNIQILRGDESMIQKVTPVKSVDDGSYKLGLWIRDSTQGIGTITYYDRENNKFGALGHPINDVDTGELMEIEGGEILEAEIKRAEKGKAGVPGALVGNIYFDKTIGYVESNKNNGVFGSMCEEINGIEMPIGYKNDVKIGNASIYVNIDDKFVDKYSIHIDSINKYNTSDTKNFVLTITDKNLLNMTGGIVQGMSGCPIVQNGKLVGAVTHVFVNDPTKGYGIFIENMMDF